MEAEAALQAVCTNPGTYLSIPTGSTVDIGAVMAEFCSNNWIAISTELMSDVNYQHIAAQVGINELVLMSNMKTELAEYFMYTAYYG